MSRIVLLPPDAISSIQSSKQIISLQGVALALMENSLDAGSTKVEITVDFRRGCCTIEDNGSGIPSAEFLEAGGLGKLYHTSKHQHSAEDVHGSTGTYLASLGALSYLSITSKHADDDDSATLAIHQAKTIARHIPSPQSYDLTLSPSHGTRAVVRDLFGNMPVRVKQRAITEESVGEESRAWRELRHGVVATLLAWSRACSVEIQDINIESSKVRLGAHHPSFSHTLTEKSLNQLAGAMTRFDLKDNLPTLIQAGLAPTECRKNWIPLSAASSTISVKGLLCLDPVPTKACQFIALGVRPCALRAGYINLYDAVNRMFSNSSFGAAEDDSIDIDDAEKDRRKRDRRFKTDGLTRKQTQGRKGVDRWPMFVLQVKFRSRTGRADRLNERSLKAIIALLEVAVREWLVTNHFRPRREHRSKQRQDEQSPQTSTAPSTPGRKTSSSATPNTGRLQDVERISTAKRRKVVDLSGRALTADGVYGGMARPASADFSSWSRIKSGKHALYNDLWADKKPRTAPAGQVGSVREPVQIQTSAFQLPILEAGELNSRTSTVNLKAHLLPRSRRESPTSTTSGADQSTSSDDFGSIDSEGLIAAAEQTEDTFHIGEPSDALVEWTDSRTKQTFQVNARTGVVLPNRSRPSTAQEARDEHETLTRISAAINTSRTSIGLPLTLSKRPSTASKKNSERWLPGFLKQWNNPVFTRQEEERIHVVSFDGPGIDVSEIASHNCKHDATVESFDQRSGRSTRTLSKSALQNAKVIRQVDRKFILCKVQEGADEVLVLVDQHAASERIILEGLFEELCAPVDEAERLTTGSKVKTAYLENRLRFEVSEAEFDLLNTHSGHFANWGILYNLKSREEVLSASQVRQPKQEHTIIVKALPPGIVERCVLFPKLLIELLRSEIWALSASAKRPIPRLDTLAKQEPHHAWLMCIGACPKGLLDLLNSRACRSAIMFNDELSIERCEELLHDLSKCAFPFMCAHGRISMVPLLELGTVGINDHDTSVSIKSESDIYNSWSFTAAFSKWGGIRHSSDRSNKVQR